MEATSAIGRAPLLSIFLSRSYVLTQAHFHLLNHEQDVKKGNHIESLEVHDGNREHGLGRLILVFVREVTYGKDTNGR